MTMGGMPVDGVIEMSGAQGRGQEQSELVKLYTSEQLEKLIERDTTYPLIAALQIGFDPERPASIVDMDSVSSGTKEQLKNTIAWYMTRNENSFGYLDSSNNFSKKLENVFSSSIIPHAVSLSGIDLKGLMQFCTSPRLLQRKEKYGEFLKDISKKNLSNIVANEEAIVDFIRALFDDCSDSNEEISAERFLPGSPDLIADGIATSTSNKFDRQKYYARQRKMLLLYLFALVDFNTNYDDSSKVFAEFESYVKESMEMFFETIKDTKISADEFFLQIRLKGWNRLLKKVFRKSSVIREKVIKDMFGGRTVMFDGVKDAELDIMKALLEKFADRFVQTADNVAFEHEGKWLSEHEKSLNPILDKHGIKKRRKPDSSFQSLKFTGQYKSQKEVSTKRFPFEFQFIMHDSGNEVEFSNHLFYEIFNEMEFICRDKGLVTRSDIKKLLLARFVDHCTSLREKLDHLKNIDDNEFVFHYLKEQQELVYFSEETQNKCFPSKHIKRASVSIDKGKELMGQKIMYVEFVPGTSYLSDAIKINGTDVWVREPSDSLKKVGIRSGRQTQSSPMAVNYIESLVQGFCNNLMAKKFLLPVHSQKGDPVQKYVVIKRIRDHYISGINRKKLENTQIVLPLSHANVLSLGERELIDSVLGESMGCIIVPSDKAMQYWDKIKKKWQENENI